MGSFFTNRAFGYQKAISALKNHPRKVDSREEATKIPNVGKKMADKIVEIVEEGSLRKVQEVCDNERIRTLDLFGRVWGAGPATAEKWYGQGLRTLQDLRLLPQESLSKHQQIGLRLFEDLDERMQREECTEILEQVTEVALKVISLLLFLSGLCFNQHLSIPSFLADSARPGGHRLRIVSQGQGYVRRP